MPCSTASKGIGLWRNSAWKGCASLLPPAAAPQAKASVFGGTEAQGFHLHPLRNLHRRPRHRLRVPVVPAGVLVVAEPSPAIVT